MIEDQLSHRMQNIPFSNIRHVFERVAELQSQGRTPAPFHIGQPDFDTPEHIKQAAKDALDRGMTAYTSNYGLPALRAAIAEKLLHDNNIQVDPDQQILVTVGTNEAIWLAMLATLNPGDEVLIPNPSWMHYRYCAQLAGARVIDVPLREQNKYQLDPDDLARFWTPRAKMLVLNTPHNPTGVVFSLETINAIANFVAERDLLLLSDEIYEKIIYDDQVHFSPGAIEAIKDRTITVNGFSKAYAMTGWRIGYAAAHPQLIGAMVRVHQYTNICATAFAQAGALAALRGSQECVTQMVAEFDLRRKFVITRLQPIEGVNFIPPQGAFYVFVNFSLLNNCSEEVAQLLLEQANVAVVPGRAFGSYGEGWIRLSFACSLAYLKSGLAAISSFVEQNLPNSIR